MAKLCRKVYSTYNLSVNQILEKVAKLIAEYAGWEVLPDTYTESGRTCYMMQTNIPEINVGICDYSSQIGVIIRNIDQQRTILSPSSLTFERGSIMVYKDNNCVLIGGGTTDPATASLRCGLFTAEDNQVYYYYNTQGIGLTNDNKQWLNISNSSDSIQPFLLTTYSTGTPQTVLFHEDKKLLFKNIFVSSQNKYFKGLFPMEFATGVTLGEKYLINNKHYLTVSKNQYAMGINTTLLVFNIDDNEFYDEIEV